VLGAPALRLRGAARDLAPSRLGGEGLARPGTAQRPLWRHDAEQAIDVRREKFRAACGLETKFNTATPHALGDGTAQLKLLAFGWDAARWLTLAPNFVYNDSVVARAGAADVRRRCADVTQTTEPARDRSAKQRNRKSQPPESIHSSVLSGLLEMEPKGWAGPQVQEGAAC
jgi:hypothetical protein